MIAKITLAASCLLLAIVYSITSCSNETPNRKKKKKFPPGPRGYPFVGVTFSIDTNRIHHHFLDWKQQYGEIFMTKMMGKNIVVISNPDLLRKAFSGEELSPFLSDRPLNFIGEMVMYGYKDILLRRYDETFVQMKVLLLKHMQMHGFHSPHFQALADQEFKCVISQFRETGGRATNPIDILMPSFCRMIGMFFFGKLVTSEERLTQCITVIERNGDIMIRPNVHNVYKSFPWIRKCCGYYGNLYRSVIRERDVLLQTIKELKEKENSQTQQGEGHGLVSGLLNSGTDWLTDEHVNGMLMDLINTATLTTKSVMSGFIFLWLHFPEMQRNIREEIDNVIGRDREPNIRDIDAMPYTYACMYETLRYQSHLPLTAPHANLSQEVDIDGFTIPKGSVIFGNQYAIHHDEAIWGDPWAFRPERYLTKDGKLVPEEHSAMTNCIPFGVGKRHCVGKDMAIYRMFLYTTYLLQSFEFLPVEGAELPSHDPRNLILESPVLIPSGYTCQIIPR